MKINDLCSLTVGCSTIPNIFPDLIVQFNLSFTVDNKTHGINDTL